MRSPIPILLALCFLGAVAVAGAGGKLPPPQGKAVIHYITQTAPYKKWSLWPGKGRFYKGTPPHGAYLITHVNPAALEAIQGKAGSLPDGAMVVKENYTPDKKLASVTVMYKRQGYNPGEGDYFWLKYAPDGTVQAEGKVKSCIQCHSLRRTNDFLYSGPLQ